MMDDLLDEPDQLDAVMQVIEARVVMLQCSQCGERRRANVTGVIPTPFPKQKCPQCNEHSMSIVEDKQ